MHGTCNRSGFSLIEIMVALMIVGLLAAIISPNLVRRQPDYERQQFLGHLNALLRFTAQQAIITRTVHRLYFDFKNNKVIAQVKGEGKNEKGEPLFVPIKGRYLHSTLTWPKNLVVKQFSIEGTDEMARDTRPTEFWFFIVPEGLTQDVVINMLDINKAYRDKPKQVGLVLNPFAAQFKIYESFQK